MVNLFVKSTKFLLSFLPIVLVGVTAGSPVVEAKMASEVILPSLLPLKNQTYCFVDSTSFQRSNIFILEDKKPLSFQFEAEIVEAHVSELPEIVIPVHASASFTQEAEPTIEPTLVITPPLQAPPESINHSADLLFALVNNERVSRGLPLFEKDPRVCEIAQMRGPELYNEIVVTRTMHAGLHNRQFPFWITENVIHIKSLDDAIVWWLNSPIHRKQMLGDYKYACTACSGKSCVLVMTNFVPKQTVSPLPSLTEAVTQ